MAYSRRTSFRQSQGNRRLAPRYIFAPAQIAGLAIGAFLCGIAAAGSKAVPFFLMLAGVAVAAIISIISRRAAAALLFLTAAFAGLCYYHAYFAIRDAAVNMPIGERASFSGVVVTEPARSAKTVHFRFRLAPPLKGTVRVFVDPGSSFAYGDELVLAGRIEPAGNERDLPAIFYPKADKIGADGGWGVRRMLFATKRHLVGALSRYLPAEEAAFMSGITLGDTTRVSPEFVRALAASGTTHLVALSGYNIAILVLVFFGGSLRVLSRRGAFVATSIAIVVFVLMVGAEPSVVRAAAMGFMVLLAREIGRPYGLGYAVLWTAFFMVVYNPAALFMPGFQLSFMALLGIVYLAPVFLEWGIGEHLALTIAAQLAVAPIALNSFGMLSVASLAANALILPFMPITMLCGFILMATGLLLPAFGALVSFVAHALLAYEIGVIHFFAVFPLPIQGSLPWWATCGYYGVLLLAVRHYEAHMRTTHGRS